MSLDRNKCPYLALMRSLAAQKLNWDGLSRVVGKMPEKPFKFLVPHFIFLISNPYLCRPKFIINYGQSLSGYR